MSSVATGVSGYTLELFLTLVRQEVANNRSLVRITARVMLTGSNWKSTTTSNPFSLTVDGVTNAGSFSYNFSQTNLKVLYTTERWYSHNSNGTKSISGSVSINTDPAGAFKISSGSPATSESLTLPTIARKSSIANYTSPVTAGGVMAITIDRAASGFTHRLRYAFGGDTDTIVTTSADSYNWTVPLSLLTQIPDDLSGWGTLYLDTMNGSTVVGTDYVGFTLNVPSTGKPTIGGATFAEMTTSPAVASLIGGFVQGVSKIKVTMTGVTPYQGSPIVDASITINSQTIPGQTGTTPLPVSASGSVPATLSVTDSRGRTGTKVVNVTVLAYAAPAITSLQVLRVVGSGGTVQDDEGTYARILVTTVIKSLVVSSTERNTGKYTLQYWNPTTSTWVNDRLNIARPIGTSTTPIVAAGTVSTDASRIYRLTVTDDLISTMAEFSLASGVILHLDGTAGIGVGKKRQRGGLDLVGDEYLTGHVYPAGSTTQRLMGMADIPTSTEAIAGTDNAHIMTPLRVKDQITGRLATQAQAEAGTDNTDLMTALRVKQANIKQSPTMWRSVEAVPSVPSGGSINVTYTFASAGFLMGTAFTAAPVVTATTTIDRHEVVVSSVTTTSCVLRFTNRTAAASAGDVHIIAI